MASLMTGWKRSRVSSMFREISAQRLSEPQSARSPRWRNRTSAAVAQKTIRATGSRARPLCRTQGTAALSARRVESQGHGVVTVPDEAHEPVRPAVFGSHERVHAGGRLLDRDRPIARHPPFALELHPRPLYQALIPFCALRARAYPKRRPLLDDPDLRCERGTDGIEGCDLDHLTAEVAGNQHSRSEG